MKQLNNYYYRNPKTEKGTNIFLMEREAPVGLRKYQFSYLFKYYACRVRTRKGVPSYKLMWGFDEEEKAFADGYVKQVKAVAGENLKLLTYEEAKELFDVTDFSNWSGNYYQIEKQPVVEEE